MIIQDIKNGEGVCMIDPHGSDIQEILAAIPQDRLEDVIYFDPSYTERPMGLNMLEYDVRFPEQKTFVVNEMMSIFNKLFDMKVAGGPMFEQYFRNATMLVIDDPESGNTLLDVSRVLSDQSFRNMKISKCKNPTVVQFWTEIASKAGGEASLANIVPYITSKFDVFLSNDIMRPVIAQKESSFDFRKIMDEKKILLVNLAKGRLGDINSNLIGLIIVGKLLMAALSRVDSLGKDFPPFYLYIDEFQNITTDSISAILSEARKYKLSLCVAHQFIAQLQENIRDAVFGNIGSMAVFRVGAEDAKFLETQFAPRFAQKDIMNIENFNFYLKMLNEGVPVEPFNVKLPPKQEFDLSRVEDIKQLSYLKYGKDRGEVEGEIMKNLRKEPLSN
jgi:type IV secretory pathway TraG/TraD family ATPase VirD4